VAGEDLVDGRPEARQPAAHRFALDLKGADQVVRKW
jgi:hypothetical protein